MTITKEKARMLVNTLKQRNEAGESWRAIAAGYPRRADGSQIVKHGTLNRIVTSNGAWLPKDSEILVALGLKEARVNEPQPESLQRRKKAIRRMARDTKKAVIRRKP